MMATFLLVVLVLLGGVVIYAARQPDVFRVGRMRYMGVQPAQVFPYLQTWTEIARWSPLGDASVAKAYSVAPSGVGARVDASTTHAAGYAVIVESVANSRVRMRVELTRPMKASGQMVIELEAVDGGTEVLWTLTAQQHIWLRVMDIFMNAEARCERAMDRGLAALRLLVERT